MNSLKFIIEDPAQQERIDKVLNALCPDLSRTRIKALIDEGHVWLNGKTCNAASRKLRINDTIKIDIPPAVVAELKAQDIALDIVYEDSDMLVINKAAGMVVHPGAGNHSGTLVNALLHHSVDDLSGIGGVMRPGIVHRLDKDTSGLMVAAKNDIAHRGLAAQLETRTLTRIYKALVLGVPFPAKGVVDAPLGRHPSSRLKNSIRRTGGKDARTHYILDEKLGPEFSLVECKLETGRTHQIRVHMESIRHPLIGDALYGPQASALKAALKRGGYSEEAAQAVLAFPRQALHAQRIAFVHPVSGEEMSFEVPLPEDMSNILKLLNNFYRK
jgi:23S rRNA pseudouridine1911/1915/1917 synthase